MSVKIADILTPENWERYGRQQILELSAFWQSGIISRMQGITLPQGGGTINLPHFGRISGDPETLSDSDPLTVAKIGAGKQVAVVCARGKAWGVNDLAELMAGDDPAAAIYAQLAAWWTLQDQHELLSTLKGVFAADSMNGNVFDVSAKSGGAAVFDGHSFIDACAVLGDRKSQITAVAMHSAVEAKLAKDNLIEYETVAGKTDRVPYYLGKRVIVDDGMPSEGGVFTSYIFGTGSVGYDDDIVGKSSMELDRDILSGEDVFTMRRRWILHVKGTKWTGTPAKQFPTREELATGTNWERVFEPKEIPVIQFKARIAAA